LSFPHTETRPAIGIILLQLGTPDAPTAEALRPYLRQFLSDPRVIDLPRIQWLPVLYGIVLRTRPRQSAALYKKVWTPEGSPLRVITDAQARALESSLSAGGSARIRVVTGMRYGQPSIEHAVSELVSAGVNRVLAFPMYPQYAGATTGTSVEELFARAGKLRVVPAVRVVPPYFDDPHYIDALAAVARDSLSRLPQPPTHVVTSYHGVPKRYVDEGDPYRQQCTETTQALEKRMGVPLTLTFQSQFGKEEWLQPYTDKVLEELGRTGARVAVMCPGFTADCLETLEEIAIRGQEQFQSTGGRDYLAIPCLNDHPAWLDAMTAIARRELSGWM
jgi:ferrochelatase